MPKVSSYLYRIHCPECLTETGRRPRTAPARAALPPLRHHLIPCEMGLFARFPDRRNAAVASHAYNIASPAKLSPKVDRPSVRSSDRIEREAERERLLTNLGRRPVLRPTWLSSRRKNKLQLLLAAFGNSLPREMGGWTSTGLCKCMFEFSILFLPTDLGSQSTADGPWITDLSRNFFWSTRYKTRISR